MFRVAVVVGRSLAAPAATRGIVCRDERAVVEVDVPASGTARRLVCRRRRRVASPSLRWSSVRRPHREMRPSFVRAAPVPRTRRRSRSNRSRLKPREPGRTCRCRRRSARGLTSICRARSCSNTKVALLPRARRRSKLSRHFQPAVHHSMNAALNTLETSVRPPGWHEERAAVVVGDVDVPTLPRMRVSRIAVVADEHETCVSFPARC